MKEAPPSQQPRTTGKGSEARTKDAASAPITSFKGVNEGGGGGSVAPQKNTLTMGQHRTTIPCLLVRIDTLVEINNL